MERMPVLEELIASGGSKEDLVVLHINHCMDNSFYFNRQLEKTGARVIFVAAPYNDRRAGCEGEEVCYRAAEMENGFRIVRFQRGTDGHESWEKCLPETEFAGAVRAMIDEALKRDVLPLVKEGKRWLLLEDGGYHYPVLNAFFEEYPDIKRTFLGCVEQTMSGTRNALAASPDYPVLSAARSLYKLRVEAYFVGMRIVDKLRQLLHERGEFLDHREVLILGYGIIGRSLALSLRGMGCHVTVSDRDLAVCEAAAVEGFALWRPWRGEAMPPAFLVLGTVGQPSFTADMLGYFQRGKRKRMYLASASSKRVEFEAVLPVLERFACQKNAFSTVCRLPGEREIVLLGNGYPLNFADPEEESLTYAVIDPVFGEMYLLADVLYRAGRENSLGAGLRLLGCDRSLNRLVDEEALVERWNRQNDLAFPISLVHPQEKRLQNALKGSEGGRWGLFFSHWRDEKQVIREVMEQMREICQRLRLEPEVSSRAALCTEELAVNVIRHGFGKTEEPFLGISVEMNEKGLWISLRDNGMAFDPAGVSETDVSLPASQRSPGGLGVFLVRRLADGIVYQRQGDTNVMNLHFNIRKGGESHGG